MHSIVVVSVTYLKKVKIRGNKDRKGSEVGRCPYLKWQKHSLYSSLDDDSNLECLKHPCPFSLGVVKD